MRDETNRDLQLRKSYEDYLEAMLMLEEEFGAIRSVDVAAKLNVTKPSVSYATRRLRENNYITMEPHGQIYLTEEGRAIAESVYDRHKTLTNLLIKLGVSPEIARKDACQMEHDISEESYQAIARHAKEYTANE